MAKLTEAEVHAAAAALDAQGVKPTTAKVREKLGRGSFSTIQEMMSTYEGTTKDNTDDSETPEELESLLPIIWTKCEAIARERFEAEKAELERRIKELNEENEVLKKIINQNENTIESIEAQRDSARRKVDVLESQAEALKEKVAYYRGKADGKAPEKSSEKKTANKTKKIPANLESQAVPGMEDKFPTMSDLSI
jgi:TolA-binding protein